MPLKSPASKEKTFTKDIPKYALLCQRLREEILSAPVGQRIPTVRALMSQHGVSMATVTRALRTLGHEGLISAHVGRGTVTSRPPSITVDAGAPRVVGAIFPRLDDQFYGPLLQAIERRCMEEGWHLLVRHLDGHPERLHSHYESLREAKISGLIYVPRPAADLQEFQNLNYEFLEKFVPLNMPGVVIDQEIFGSHFPCVRSDHSSGAQLVANHLCALGHKNVCFVESYPSSSTKLRWDAFSKHMKARGCHAAHLIEPGIGHDPSVVRATLKKILSRSPKPTAAFVVNDRAALNLLFECQRQGVAVPGELSLIGFDDLEISRWCEPPLTSVAQPLAEIGRLAAEVLIEQIKGTRVVQPEIIILPVKLLERSSSGPRPEH